MIAPSASLTPYYRTNTSHITAITALDGGHPHTPAGLIEHRELLHREDVASLATLTVLTTKVPAAVI